MDAGLVELAGGEELQSLVKVVHLRGRWGGKISKMVVILQRPDEKAGRTARIEDCCPGCQRREAARRGLLITINYCMLLIMCYLYASMLVFREHRRCMSMS
jgi:hypothetical protein